MFFIKLNRSCWLIITSFLLAACSIFSPVKTESINEYVVDTVSYGIHTHRGTTKTLAVSLPTANAIYRTKEMAYSIKPHEINYFAKNRWAETPAQMLHPLMIQTLQNAHHFKVVAPPTGIGRYDLLLSTQVLKFYQDFCESGSVFRLTVRAQMIKVSNGKVLASKEFTVIEPAPCANPYGGVIAANRSTEKMLSQLSFWSANCYEAFAS